jgi:hypothetical protein
MRSHVTTLCEYLDDRTEIKEPSETLIMQCLKILPLKLIDSPEIKLKNINTIMENFLNEEENHYMW